MERESGRTQPNRISGTYLNRIAYQKSIRCTMRIQDDKSVVAEVFDRLVCALFVLKDFDLQTETGIRKQISQSIHLRHGIKLVRGRSEDQYILVLNRIL